MLNTSQWGLVLERDRAVNGSCVCVCVCSVLEHYLVRYSGKPLGITSNRWHNYICRFFFFFLTGSSRNSLRRKERGEGRRKMDRNKGEKKLGVGEEGTVREAGTNCRCCQALRLTSRLVRSPRTGLGAQPPGSCQGDLQVSDSGSS